MMLERYTSIVDDCCFENDMIGLTEEEKKSGSIQKSNVREVRDTRLGRRFAIVY